MENEQADAGRDGRTGLANKLGTGTGPMAYAVLNNKMDAAAEIGRNRVSNTTFSRSMENEQADAGRDGQTGLARPSSQARTGTRKYCFSLFSSPRAELAILPGRSTLLLY